MKTITDSWIRIYFPIPKVMILSKTITALVTKNFISGTKVQYTSDKGLVFSVLENKSQLMDSNLSQVHSGINKTREVK